MTTSLPILNFHSLDERPSAISFSPALFRRAMSCLHERGYRTLGLPEVLGRLGRREPLPGAAFVLTFDDGYRSVYEEAFPVLREFGFNATLFITTGARRPARASSRLPTLEGRPMLSWSEIREMHAQGFAVGSHTLTHADLTRLAAPRVEEEVGRSKLLIEDALGSAVDCFAYPFGAYDARSREVVSRHYDGACSTRLGVVGRDSDPYALERVETYYLRSPRLFGLVPGPLLPLYLRARRAPRALRRTLLRGHE